MDNIKEITNKIDELTSQIKRRIFRIAILDILILYCSYILYLVKFDTDVLIGVVMMLAGGIYMVLLTVKTIKERFYTKILLKDAIADRYSYYDYYDDLDDYEIIDDGSDKEQNVETTKTRKRWRKRRLKKRKRKSLTLPTN